VPDDHELDLVILNSRRMALSTWPRGDWCAQPPRDPATSPAWRSARRWKGTASIRSRPARYAR